MARTRAYESMKEPMTRQCIVLKLDFSLNIQLTYPSLTFQLADGLHAKVVVRAHKGAYTRFLRVFIISESDSGPGLSGRSFCFI